MSIDPFDAATSAGEFAGTFFGKLEVTAQFVTLKKGVGKQVFDENSDDISDRRTEISILLNPIDQMNMSNFIQRQIIAESSEWSRFVWPSCRDLGVSNARELNGKYAKAEMVKTGRKWTTREGEERENTTFKFTAFYDSEAACVAAYEGERGVTEEEETDNGGAVSVERETALQFLPALIKQAAGDKSTLAQLIANMPMISKHFTVDSPEVQTLLEKEAV